LRRSELGDLNVFQTSDSLLKAEAKYRFPIVARLLFYRGYRDIEEFNDVKPRKFKQSAQGGSNRLESVAFYQRDKSTF
jgi:hypothetical protein